MKKVTRTYIKKDGTKVVKTYNYDKKYSSKVKDKGIRKIQIFTKKGEFTKRGQQIFKEMLDSVGNDVTAKEAIKDIVWSYKHKVVRGKVVQQGKFLTSEQVLAMYSTNKVRIMLANFRIDPEDIKQELELMTGQQISVDWILDESHWNFKGQKSLLLPNNQIAYFALNYEEHSYVIDSIE